MKNLLSLLLLFTFHGSFLFSQNYSVKTIIENKKEDFFCIAKDSVGFLWIGGKNRLIRYDGFEQKVYFYQPLEKNSIPIGEITDIEVDRNNNLWLLCSGYVSIFNPSTGKIIRNKINDLEASEICVVEDKIFICGWGEILVVDLAGGKKFRFYFNDWVKKSSRTIIDEINVLKPLASIDHIVDSEDRKALLEIKKDGNYIVVMTGEGYRDQNLTDFGTIEDQRGIEIWRPDDIKTNFYNGGNYKNRLFIDTVFLAVGHYQIKYKSDDSHSSSAWNGDPPTDVNFYGIRIYEDLKSKSTREENSLEIIIGRPAEFFIDKQSVIILDMNYNVTTISKNGHLLKIDSDTMPSKLLQDKLKFFPTISTNDFSVQTLSGEFLVFTAHDLKYLMSKYSKLGQSFLAKNFFITRLKDPFDFLNMNRYTYAIYDFEQKSLDTFSISTSIAPGFCAQENGNEILTFDLTRGLSSIKKNSTGPERIVPPTPLNLFDLKDFYRDQNGYLWVLSSSGLRLISKRKINYVGETNSGRYFQTIKDTRDGLGKRFPKWPVYNKKSPVSTIATKGISLENDIMNQIKSIPFEGIEEWRFFERITGSFTNNNKDFIIVKYRNLGWDGKWENLKYFLIEIKDSISINQTTNISSFLADEIPANVTYNFADDSDTNLTLLQINDKLFTYDSQESALRVIHEFQGSDRYYQSIYSDSLGGWVCQFNQGLVYISGKGYTIDTLYFHQDTAAFSSGSNFIISPDKNSIYWVNRSQFNELDCRTKKVNSIQIIENFPRDQSREDIILSQYFFDRYNLVMIDSIFFIGTNYAGIIEYEPSFGVKEVITEQEGLISNEVIGLIEHNSLLYGSTLEGFFQVTPHNHSIRNFYFDDSLLDNKTNVILDNVWNPLLVSNGVLIAQTSEGQIHFNLNLLSTKDFDLIPVELLINGVPKTGDVIWKQKYLALNYDQNNISLTVSAIGQIENQNSLFTYRLEGYENAWQELSSENRVIKYTNLPPGEFLLSVKTVNELGAWGPAYELKITIRPPWWQTWWFRTLVGLAILLTLFVLYRWRTKTLRSRQKQLETEIENATHEIRQQKEQVEEAHKEITDSINYAERIQRSLMASKKLLDENLNDYFIYFNPKEKVSGDFFWAHELENKKFCLVAADSTGHGVPGAIMSMLNISSLEKAVAEKISESSELLNFTRKKIIETLANDGSAEGGKDGMDAALLIFNKEKTQLEFSLANNPLWIFRNQELIEYKPDKMPVGKHDKQHIPFTKNIIDLQKGDMIYIFTDGYADQFGGEKGKKFKYSSLKELLLSIHSKPTDEQKIILDVTFENWRGRLEQVDDVCVVGVRI